MLVNKNTGTSYSLGIGRHLIPDYFKRWFGKKSNTDLDMNVMVKRFLT